MERIGLIGLGRMGQAMAGRLLAAGFPLAVTNRTRSKADALIEDGAAWADTPERLAGQADIVFTILTDDTAVLEVLSGQHGLLAGDCSGKLLVEMSTIRTATIDQLRPLVEARGARLLDAPVSGTLEPARQGQLLAMVGGAAEDLERARPALETLCRRIVHMGPSGAGTTMKLALNMPMAIFWAGLAEAMAMGQRHGLSIAQMLDVYLDSPVAMPALRGKAPLLLGEQAEVAFDVTGVRKDLLAMIATGQEASVPMPTASAALAHWAAATAAGYGEHDLAAIVEYVGRMVRDSAGEPG
ncbi:MAG TPA: NAD(P)-dependent oxidoreductase [Roseiflexaceae bacterium]|nr:NAD(P)-dependent oxidoreductase [Roseiflexaceae bacterium]